MILYFASQGWTKSSVGTTAHWEGNATNRAYSACNNWHQYDNEIPSNKWIVHFERMLENQIPKLFYPHRSRTEETRDVRQKEGTVLYLWPQQAEISISDVVVDDDDDEEEEEEEESSSASPTGRMVPGVHVLILRVRRSQSCQGHGFLSLFSYITTVFQPLSLYQVQVDIKIVMKAE